MKALQIHAGPVARRHIQANGLSPQDIRLIPAAAGGPKGLILNHLDRHIFGQWLADTDHDVHLVGASIGAWRMATALKHAPATGFEQLAQDYIAQSYEPEPGRKMPTPQRVSQGFAQALDQFFGDDLHALLRHPRYRLHVVTSRGRQILRKGGHWQTGVGMAGLAMGNAFSRRAVGLFLERTVFSAPGAALPVALTDQPTRHVALTTANFKLAMRASCSIPFLLEPVLNIPGTVPGAHWDGGLVDYHFHWPFSNMGNGLVLYPHFQKQVVPGWLDKSLKWRHGATAALDNMVLLAPNPQWVATLPGGKLPDRADFTKLDNPTRFARWTQAVALSERLADEWQAWLSNGTPIQDILPL